MLRLPACAGCCKDAFLVKPVAERTDAADTWITDPTTHHAAAGARAYLAGCATALRDSSAGAGGELQGSYMVIVTLGRREYREPLFTQAGARAHDSHPSCCCAR